MHCRHPPFSLIRGAHYTESDMIHAAIGDKQTWPRQLPFNTEIANGTFDFGMPQQKLYRSKVPRATVDQDRLSATQ